MTVSPYILPSRLIYSCLRLPILFSEKAKSPPALGHVKQMH